MSIGDILLRVQAIESSISRLMPVGEITSAAQGTAYGTATLSPPGAAGDFNGVLSGVLAAGGASGATALNAGGIGPVRSIGAMTTAGAGSLVDNGATGSDVVADARRYLGVPYVFGGTTSAGLDCSGLVQKVFGDLGVRLPRLVTGQMAMGVAVPSLAQAEPGDLIVADGGNHIAIYAGDGRIIEAPRPGLNVRERSNWITPSNTVTIRRIVPQPAAAGAAW